jgi:nicotinamidase-related amidase
MDMQAPLVERLGSPELVSAVNRAAEAARAAGVPVIYARIAFRSGHPEASPDNRIFTQVAAAGGYVDGDESTTIHSDLAPLDGDVVVTKRRVSAFAGSDLALVLESMGVKSLALAGLATSGVVLSTLTEAADRDFRLTVLRDACADGDAELAEALLDRLFPRFADVVDVDDWCAGLNEKTGV